jgi:hypothetical protein
MAGDSLEYTPQSVGTWKQFVNLYLKRFDQRSFIFRGQAIESSSLWSFQTELERVWLRMANAALVRSNDNERNALKDNLEGCDIFEAEEGLLREFKRKSSLYLSQSKPVHRLEWLALMRHYGAPTRLLDWTYSVYAAAFFALDESSPQRPATIWALDTEWIKACLSKVIVLERQDGNLWDILFKKDVHLEKEETWEKYFSGAHSFVLPVNPFRLNRRLTIQQGLFLCPGNISIPFQDNLGALQTNDARSPEALIQITLDLNHSEKKNFLRQLVRMNLTKASLFPGLQGFAQSLSLRLLFPKVLTGKSSFSS